jgi:hypothetical protein
VFLSLWVLRIVLCVFVYTGSEDCFVCTHRDKNTQNNPQNPYRKKHTKQSPEPIETKTHKITLRTQIVFCVFVYMGSEECFVCFCL